MGINKGEINGVARICRVNTVALLVFGATQHAKKENPDRDTTEIVKSVLSTFGLKIKLDSAIREYHRTLNAFLDNDGI